MGVLGWIGRRIDDVGVATQGVVRGVVGGAGTILQGAAWAADQTVGRAFNDGKTNGWAKSVGEFKDNAKDAVTIDRYKPENLTGYQRALLGVGEFVGEGVVYAGAVALTAGAAGTVIGAGAAATAGSAALAVTRGGAALAQGSRWASAAWRGAFTRNALIVEAGATAVFANGKYHDVSQEWANGKVNDFREEVEALTELREDPEFADNPALVERAVELQEAERIINELDNPELDLSNSDKQERYQRLEEIFPTDAPDIPLRERIIAATPAAEQRAQEQQQEEIARREREGRTLTDRVRRAGEDFTDAAQDSAQAVAGATAGASMWAALGEDGRAMIADLIKGILSSFSKLIQSFNSSSQPDRTDLARPVIVANEDALDRVPAEVLNEQASGMTQIAEADGPTADAEQPQPGIVQQAATV